MKETRLYKAPTDNNRCPALSFCLPFFCLFPGGFVRDAVEQVRRGQRCPPFNPKNPTGGPKAFLSSGPTFWDHSVHPKRHPLKPTKVSRCFDWSALGWWVDFVGRASSKTTLQAQLRSTDQGRYLHGALRVRFTPSTLCGACRAAFFAGRGGFGRQNKLPHRVEGQGVLPFG